MNISLFFSVSIFLFCLLDIKYDTLTANLVTNIFKQLRITQLYLVQRSVENTCHTAFCRSNAALQTLGLPEIWGCHRDGGADSSLTGQDPAEIGWNQPDARRRLLPSFVTSRMPQPAFTMNVAFAIVHLQQAHHSLLNTEQIIVSLKADSHIVCGAHAAPCR